jgi:hypothetical protein
MKKVAKRGGVLAALFLALLVSAAYRHRASTREAASVDNLLLLLPDSVSADDPLVSEWLDAAKEEGLHLEIVRDSTLLDPLSQFRAAGLIVPDQVHRSANDALIGALENYVRQGGKLMLVYDACTLDLNGFFTKVESRLSNLAGIEYALYDKYKRNTMTSEQVWGSRKTMEELEIPPGKFVPMENGGRTTLRTVSWKSDPAGKEEPIRFTFSRYLYDDLKYPSFRTGGAFDGKVLLESKAGVVAGYGKRGRGDVLFVNLPLGYLESRTDGLLLHSFLRFFATRILDLPYLASVPDGTGGLILNWHVDAASSLKPLAILERAGVFDQGPFSIDLTAGPDVNKFHDGKGLNVEENRQTQDLIRYFLQHGHVVGSHGGWIHNWFGEHVEDNNEKEMEKYLVMNQQALEKVTQQPIREYSAPMGNHPEWVTIWLQKHGYLGYYFPGDSGMGPTLVYRDKGRDAANIWGFPILHLGTEASFEEMEWDHVSERAVQNWLMAVADYTVDNHVARLVYSHPFGASQYVSVLQRWLQYTKELRSEKRFRWYTIPSLAEFLNARGNVDWSLSRADKKLLLEASHPKSLAHFTWVFPESKYSNLKVVQGSATIQQEGNLWLVTAKDCKHLAVELDGEVSKGGKETKKN